MKEKNKSKSVKQEMALDEAQKLADKISKVELKLKAKAGETGKLFGSITSGDVAEALISQHKIKIDKKKLNLSDPIKSLGEMKVDIKLHPGVTAKLTIKVEQEV